MNIRQMWCLGVGLALAACAGSPSSPRAASSNSAPAAVHKTAQAPAPVVAGRTKTVPQATTVSASSFDVRPWVGHYYAGVIKSSIGWRVGYVAAIAEKSAGRLSVEHCFHANGDYNVTKPVQSMKCLVSPATLAGNVVRLIGSQGETIKLTLLGKGTSIRFWNLLPEWNATPLTGILKKKGAVPVKTNG